MRLRVRILVRTLVVRRFPVPSSQIINILMTNKDIYIKGFTAKKSVVLNDDEPRLVPIPKDCAHLLIRKSDEVCFDIFLTQVSAFAYLIVIYNSLFYISFQVLLYIAFRRMPASMLGFLVLNMLSRSWLASIQFCLTF